MSSRRLLNIGRSQARTTSRVAAKIYGAMIVEGIVFWTRIAPFRHGDWHYKDEINSNWRFLLDWEQFLQELAELSTFAVPDR
eukprot:10376148-Lingulodinium_polyedra.AAC.1